MVLVGLGLNPAGVSLFRMHAPQSPLTSAWGLNPARVCHGFALLSTVSQILFRQPVWGRSDYPLDLNPAEVSLFRLWLQCAGVSLFVVALLGFLCLWLWLHHLSVSLGRQNATLESLTGDGFGRFGLESCWGFPVSHACPTEPFDFRLYKLDFHCKTMRTHNDTNDPQQTQEVEKSDAYPTLAISCLNCGVGGMGGSPLYTSS